MSSSDEEASVQEEKWDDMAIVRAFEDAMRGKQSEQRASPAPAKKSKPRARKEPSTRKQSVESVRGPAAAHAWNAQGFDPSVSAGANGLNAYPQNAHTQAAGSLSHDEIYQAAYAHAYAHLQAQSQATYYQNQPAPTPSYPTHQPGFSSIPQWNSGMHAQAPPPIPFPSAGGGMPPGFSTAGGSQDDLANLLMSWYQSGYYTGRYQAMQEMRTKNFR